MEILRINQGKALPIIQRLLCIVFLFSLIVYMFNYLDASYAIPGSILVSSMIPAVWFATKIFVIDSRKNCLFKGIWSMGFKSGKWISYTSFVFKVERRKTKNTIYKLTDNRHVMTDHEYIAYLKTEKEENFYLFSHPSKHKIHEKLHAINLKLGLSSN